MIKWMNAEKHKPEGEIFWALTEGRNEQGHRDWNIIKLFNCEFGDYRLLDEAASYRLPHTFCGQHWAMTIYAWAHLNEIIINDEEYE